MTRFTIKNIEIELVEHIKSISTYNHNYYKIKPFCGDYYNFYDAYDNDIIHIESYDDEAIYSVYFGKFIDGKFVPVFMVTYDEEWDI